MYFRRIKQIRLENNLKQEDVANILNIKRATYTSFEIGRDTIPLDKLNLFANYFNVSIDYIFEFTKIRRYKKATQDIDVLTVAKRLKETRKENEFTQENLADILNTNHSVWCRYEQGKFLINTSFLYAYAKLIHVSADYLLGKIDKKIIFKL